MRRHHLIAAGFSVALLVGGAAYPVVADGPGGRIKGDGRTANVAQFSVDVRENKPERGKLDYRSVDGRFKVRCKGFDTYSPRMYIVPGSPAATVTAECVLEGPRRQRRPVEVEAEFVDHSSFTRGAKDEASFKFTFDDDDDGEVVTDTGRILSGGITVR